VSDEDIDKITHRNAMRWFQFDGIAAVGGRSKATVGALRSQAAAVDLSLLRGKGGKPPADSTSRPVTARDVMAQLSTVLDGNAIPPRA
jgi:hypothetical protein